MSGLTDIGRANHIYQDGQITSVVIQTIEFEGEGLRPAVTISNEDGNDSVMINSLEQWRQLNALVLKAFDGLEE